ncbi:chain length determinant protein tyrosine kinase EpsG [Methylophilus methylotrophus]|uniref:chain length determinant protein tyrosine kinase EpsG n=1 Tax=Methylophilus methylotrophus TaxID=17 RepID=UPI000F5AB7C3|nr:chain length determinant protein tyrosine kinase EpsG [Methylophilus methylotrophus]
MNHSIIDSSSDRPFSSIGRFLLEMGKITPEDTNRILQLQKEENLKFGDAAKRLGLITDVDLQQALSRQFEYTYLPADNKKYSEDLIAAYKPFSAQVESFRVLRSQLLFRWLSEGFKTISIVGANSGEGTSYVAANLAIVFSQLGKKTLLIDGNLRQPRLQGMFALKQNFGLSDILIDRTPRTELLNIIPDIPNLTVLGAGTLPPNPQELLSREVFLQLVKYASTAFDVVIIDTPPINQGSDSQIISSVTKGAVLVSRINQTTIDEMRSLKIQIQGASASVIGAVVNNF